MSNNSLEFADFLNIVSLYLGVRNLIENQQQSAQTLKILKQNDVDTANNKQANYLLKELGRKFEEQNNMLKEILEAVRK